MKSNTQLLSSLLTASAIFNAHHHRVDGTANIDQAIQAQARGMGTVARG